MRAMHIVALQPSPKPLAKSAWRPTQEAVLEALRGLYADELKPLGMILRKRLLEGCEASSGKRSGFDVSLSELQCICRECPLVDVEADGEQGGDWAAVLCNTPGRFVDPSSPKDEYTEVMWQQVAGYFRSLPPGVTMPGGRLKCAQQLAKEALPFFAGLSLGRLCHVVQLAISQRRLLRYSSGRLVPYDNHAQLAPAVLRLNTKAEGALPTAAWPEVVGGIHSLLKTAPIAKGVVPLSNVKRLFRSQLHLELDEAALGCDKLSAVFQRLTAERRCELWQQPGGLVIAPARCSLLLLGSAPSHHKTPLGTPIDKHAWALRREGDVGVGVGASSGLAVRNTFIHLDPTEDMEGHSPRLGARRKRANSFP